jgi:cell wall-associated NlpC family hydrolase
MRYVFVIAAVIASTGCASSVAAGSYSPRPFPKARTVVEAPAPETAPVRVSGPAAPRRGEADAGDARVALSSAVVTTALGLRGIPYRLGGADLSGFDCSGLVQYVMRQHNIGMPRTVIEQFAIGDSPSSIETGDLVFFQTIGSQASHVGIAIDGESFVHAPNSRGVVRIERLDAPYWSQRFLGARRVF